MTMYVNGVKEIFVSYIRLNDFCLNKHCINCIVHILPYLNYGMLLWGKGNKTCLDMVH